MAAKAGRALEALINEALEAAPEGLSQDELQQRVPAADIERMVASLNKLTGMGRVVLFQRPNDGGVVFRAQSTEEAQKFKGLGAEDMLVYQLIKASGDIGVWTKDLKYKAALPTAIMNKALKELEKRQLVKSVKSVANTRKVYMLFELEPAREVSGGAWYTDHAFDSELIEVLQRMAMQYVRGHPGCSLGDVAAFIQQNGVCRVDLTLEEVRSVVNTLEFDERVEEYYDDEAGQDTFQELDFPLPEGVAVTDIPCGRCPVAQQCTPGGRVAPETCRYYQEWLDF